MAPIRLFNFDFHISVIADVKHILKGLFPEQIEITEWNISGHNWVFNRAPKQVDIITQQTWSHMNESMIMAFQDKYGDYLETFDGFIVTHTPVLCMLYEKYNKPVFLVNTCRYEQPFSWTGDLRMWQSLNDCLGRLNSKGLLFAVSNNKADQEYLKLGTGIQSLHIPSLCEYTGIQWSTNTRGPILYTNEGVVPDIQGLARRSQMPQPFQWADLLQRRAIVHVPYEISTMSIAEQYSAGVPLFFPTKRFLLHLWKHGGIDFQGPYARSGIYHPLVQKAVDSNYKWSFWLDRADYYDQDNMKYIKYFDSWEDLAQQISTFQETEEDTQKRLQWIGTRRGTVYQAWKDLFSKAFPALTGPKN